MLYRMSLDFGMKMGIPDRTAREATITLYLDKEKYRQALGIPDEETIVPMLITRTGEILWRSEGPLTVEKGDSLVDVINALFATNSA